MKPFSISSLVLFLFLILVQQCFGSGEGSHKKKGVRPGSLALNITTRNPSCDNRFQPTSSSRLGDGAIMASASGGTPPYTYSLITVAPPQNNGYFPGLNSGNYRVVVHDSLGETASENVYLSNTLPQPMMATHVLQLPSSCTNADGSIELMPFGGTPPYTYSSDGGLSFQPGGNIITNLQQGYYYIFLLKDANGCLAVSSTSGGNSTSNFFMCNFCCPLEISGVIDKIPCTNDGQITVFVNNSAPPIYYSLDGINYQLANGTNNDVNTFYNLTPGTYHVYAKNSDGLVTQSAFVLPKACTTTLNFLGVDPVCKQSNGTIKVTANFGIAPYTYTIDGINYQTSNVFTGLSAGNYSISAKDAMGESNSGMTLLSEKCPAVSAIATDATCGNADGTITAQGTNGSTPYLFSIDGINFQPANIFMGLVNGPYIVTLKDANGVIVSTQVSVRSNNCFQVTTASVNSTCGNSNGVITVNAANGTMPYQYSKDGINFVSTNVFSGLIAGAYTLTVKDAAGITSTATATLADAPAPAIHFAATQASCNNKNGSITITGTGGKQPLQYSIDNGLSFQNNNIYNGLDSGQYVTIIKDAHSCADTSTIQITTTPTPGVFLGDDTSVCEGETLLLHAPQSVNYAYLWQNNSTSSTFTATQQGNYIVKVTNQYNCAASDTINIRFKTLPVFTLGNDTSGCMQQIVSLTPSPIRGSYLWNTGSSSSSINVGTPGIFWLRVNNNGCFYSDTINISFKPSPYVNLGNDTALCDGQVLLLNAANTNSTYLWQDGSSSPTFTINTPGPYSVRINENGCVTTGKIMVSYSSKPVVNLVKDTTLCVTEKLVLDGFFPNSMYKWQDGSEQPQFTVSKAGFYTVQVSNFCGITNDMVTVKYDNCACKFYMPDAFTPGNDGRNDVFRPKYQCLFNDYGLKIYNRFGQLIFYSGKPENSWNGTFKGNDQPSGVYVWLMQYHDILTGKSVERKGAVLLIR